MRLWLGLFVVTASIAEGQTTGRVEGHVLSQSGEAVRKATVRLQGNPAALGGRAVTYVEISDATGKFEFDDVEPGRYTLAAARTGYTPPKSNGVSYASITIQAGEVKRDAEIRLIQLGVISGRVTDRDGDPVVGVPVQAMHVQYNGARRQLTPYTTVSSDDQGNFRIANIEPGRYYPLVDDSRRAASNINSEERRGRSAQEVDVATFYPSAPDFTGAVAVDVSAGKEAQGVNIRLLKGRVYSIRGTIDARNGAVSGLQLTLAPKTAGIAVANLRQAAQVQQPSGTFEFRGLLPGTYVIQGQRAAQVLRAGDAISSTPSLVGRTEVAVSNSDVEGVTISLSSATEITGTVRLDDGDLQAVRKGSGNLGSIALIDADESTGSSPIGQIQENGTFRIQNFGSRYWVSLRPLPAGMYVKSVRFGGQDVTKAPLDLTSGAGGALEIVLSQKAAEVTAFAHRGNGEVADGVTVSVWPKTTAAFDTGSVRILNAGATGNIRIGDLAPGEYYVAAWEEADSVLLRFPDFIAKFTGDAATVRVGESDKTTVDLTLIPKDKIAAEVAKLP